MKRFVALVLAMGFGGASAWGASNLNISVKSGGLSTVTVAPNATVNFQVEGILSNDLNEGLALVGFDLHFTGGALTAGTVATPSGALSCPNPMPAFVKPNGITNPAGFGGTLIGSDLVQVGGGQNTIKNSIDNPACAPNCAPFPVGAVLTGVAQPAVCGTAVIATGSLTAPGAGGSYQLQVLNLFANVIKDGETGTVFWATEAAGVGTITNLTINVGVCPGIASSSPSNCAIDARQPHDPGNPSAVRGWNSVALTFGQGCDVAGASAADFTVACTPPGAPCPTITSTNTVDQTVTVNLSGVIPAGKWTCITHTASTSNGQVCLGSLPCDANGDRTCAPSDILEIIDNLNGVRLPPLQKYQCDIDRSDLCAPADILSEIDLLNGANNFLVWNGRTLAVCPATP